MISTFLVTIDADEDAPVYPRISVGPNGTYPLHDSGLRILDPRIPRMRYYVFFIETIVLRDELNGLITDGGIDVECKIWQRRGKDDLQKIFTASPYQMRRKMKLPAPPLDRLRRKFV